MIIVYCVQATEDAACRFDRRVLASDEPIPADAVWIDLVDPTKEDDQRVERHLGISIPTREDMADIEPSELLYQENGARYLTARVVHQIDVDPTITGISFILKDRTMVTVRYADPKAFQMFQTRIARPGGCEATAEAILAGLFETIIDRAADVLQATAARLDRLSDRVFEAKTDPGTRNAEFQDTLRELGRHGDVVSKIRESLVSIERVLLFVSVSYRSARVPIELREQVRTTLRDLQSMEEHATFQSQKIQFLLDATLGLVNLEQNNIIKLFSVMAVIFMPPTLVASIYGMNFKFMPELDWHYGYPMAVGIMVMAGLLPYLFFRWKKWL
ncbi:magnesium/cobalt transporter CorA [Alsobacter sp. R-9]